MPPRRATKAGRFGERSVLSSVKCARLDQAWNSNLSLILTTETKYRGNHSEDPAC